MPRGDNQTDALPGQDSFLDIVANIVGILILLVMVVGLRAAQTAPGQEQAHQQADEAATPAVSDADVKLAVNQALAARRVAEAKITKALHAAREVALRDDERVEVATFVATVEDEIEQRRAAMSEERRRDFDLQAQLGAAQHELEALTRERVGIVPDAPTVQQIESLPTPLSQTVSGDEVQLRLAGGRVRVIPWERLNELAKDKAQSELWRLDSRDSMTIMVGPVDGFRVKYLVAKKTFATRQGVMTQIGSVGQILLPGDDVTGETIEEALQPHSALMQAIRNNPRARKPTVTVWTYPESFGDFRKLKAALFDQGYAVAGRPLPEGTPIARSPRGTKSSAQ